MTKAGVLGLLSTLFLLSSAIGAQRIGLIVEGPLTPPAKLAVADLTKVLQDRHIEVVHNPKENSGLDTRFVIGLAGKSKTVDQCIKSAKLALSEKSESLAVAKIPTEAGRTILIAGRDTCGLSYALLDVARAIELTPAEASWLDGIPEGFEQPHLRQRSVTIHLSNRDLDDSWYFDEAFWRDYFSTLARSRFNNVTLTFADQMNYLNPVYAHLVDVPGFDQVRASDVTPEGKRRNLKMLHRITELADERGLDFTFAVWTQQPVEKFGGEITVENMPQGRRFVEYCSQGLATVLKACPSIDAVQFRMNTESGISEDEQTSYYQSQFDAIRNCGRPVRLELRYKGLQPETIQQAVNTGLDLTVSTKFWCEHLGLPYHPTAEDTHYRESRYGYGAMLAKGRKYRVIYRLWTVGSHRLLLWADPSYTARFAESCRLGGGEGFEIFAPLTNKGYENAPGAWRIFADRSYESYRWEQQRYWFYYLTFGRMGYNPQCSPVVWQREFRHRFGQASGDVETAYRVGSKILPLLTATRTPSASEWRWWPEMDTGGPLQEYMHSPPSDTAQFYGIRTWKRTPEWWRETWDEFPAGFVEDAVDGKVSGRATPLQVSAQLNQLAQRTLRALENAGTKIAEKDHAEFRPTRLDMQVHAYLAIYHSEKARAAAHLAFFQVTDDSGRLLPALEHMQKARNAWAQIVKLTEGVYHHNLLFGHGKNSKRSRHDHHHGGHWKDRLPEVEADVDYLQALLKKHKPVDTKYQRFPLEQLSNERPRIEHTPPEFATVGNKLTIHAKVTSRHPLKQVRLYYRPLDQTVDWKHMEMLSIRDGQYEITVPGIAILDRWDFMYYLEAVDARSATLWPRWQNRQPYFVIKVRNTSGP